MNSIVSRCAAIAAAGIALAVGIGPLPASARDFVQDQAGMFSQLDRRAAQPADRRLQRADAEGDRRRHDALARRQRPCRARPQAAFAQQNVNGVLIFIARDDRRDIIVPDRVGHAGRLVYARRAALDSHVDGGAVSQRIVRRRHHRCGRCHPQRLSRSRRRHAQRRGGCTRRRARASLTLRRFPHLHVLVDHHRRRRLLDLALGPARDRRHRALRRRARRAAGGAAAGSAPPGTVRATVRSGRYGGFGGGGSFWSGLLGGLGGAWLGNELFRGRRRHRAGARRRKA